MELIFRKKFLRDARALGNKELAIQLEKIFRQIEKADSPDSIGGLVKLENYSRYYRIRIKISETRDYRLVLSIRRSKVWVERIALANKIFYKR
jgi:mRNA-degrading endonuclease RelE of RelBE toxin-antitoxin system